MSDHAEGLADPRPTAPEPAAGSEPVVTVVPYRPDRTGVKFLPPLLILVLCVGFLAYRSSARNWRGASAFDGNVWSWLLPRPPVRSEPGPPAKVARTTPVPTRPNADLAGNSQPAPSPKDDALGDIEREAEATHKRIAELEKMKEEEAKKLAQTEDQRRREAQRDNPRQFRLPAAEIERRLAALRELQRHQIDEMMRRQMAWMNDQMARNGARANDQRRWLDEMQRRQLDEFNDFQRRFFNHANGAGLPEIPGGPGPRPMAPLMPRFGQVPSGPGGRQGEQRFFTPDGGIGRFRGFSGPDGVSGFEMHWQSGPDAPADPIPRPPQPGRNFD